MMRISPYATIATALALSLLTSTAIAQTSNDSKINFVSGGVGVEGREELASRGKEFNFKLVTAMEKSGHYVAGTNVKVMDAKGKEVLATTMQGPWLLADLPPGKYRLEATHDGATMTKTVAIPESGRREAYLYWPVEEPVSEQEWKAYAPSVEQR
jgi:hypothetical protein